MKDRLWFRNASLPNQRITLRRAWRHADREETRSKVRYRFQIGKHMKYQIPAK